MEVSQPSHNSQKRLLRKSLLLHDVFTTAVRNLGELAILCEMEIFCFNGAIPFNSIFLHFDLYFLSISQFKLMDEC